ncbi:MAG TPA: hypothetical protein DDW55_13735 [Gammaproteobacteria bacterium]|nr:hypothetical protein [Gammaproteobacteria bacterium]
MKYIFKLALIVIACVFGNQLLAFGGMSADEVSTLFSGNTVEGERRDGGVPGIDAPNKIEDHATAFIAYFENDGTVKMKTGSKPKLGKWRVTDDSELCIKWKGKKEKCAPVHKEGKVYKRVIERRSGFVLFELRYIRFTPGNEYGL